MEAVQGNFLYLHGYGKEGFGQHAGITAFNFKSKTTTWIHPDLRFYGLATNFLIAQNISGSQESLVKLNPNDGNLLSGTISVSEAKILIAQKEKASSSFWQVPGKYFPDQPYFEAVAQFVLANTGREAVLAIEYLEWKKYIIIGFFQLSSNRLNEYVVQVFSVTGNLIIEEVLGVELSGNSLDTFFIMQDTLILIKNKKSLLGFRL